MCCLTPTSYARGPRRCVPSYEAPRPLFATQPPFFRSSSTHHVYGGIGDWVSMCTQISAVVLARLKPTSRNRDDISSVLLPTHRCVFYQKHEGNVMGTLWFGGTLGGVRSVGSHGRIVFESCWYLIWGASYTVVTTDERILARVYPSSLVRGVHDTSHDASLFCYPLVSTDNDKRRAAAAINRVRFFRGDDTNRRGSRRLGLYGGEWCQL